MSSDKGRKDPAFPLYARDWMMSRSVRMLPREMRSTLVDLWCLQWIDGDLPDNPEWLAGECRAPVDDVRALLSEFFERTAKGWRSERLEEERDKRRSAVNQRRQAGKNGAARRWGMAN